MTAAEDITNMLAEDKLQHRIAERYSLEQAALAHQKVEAGGLDGCVVLEF